MEKPKKRVTSADVARLSGVSRATVSYVLNNTPSQTISPKTRERVLDAARVLGYVPSSVGLALAKGRTDIVVLDLGSLPLSEYQVGRFASAFSRHLERAGATVVVHLSDGGDTDGLLRLVRATQPFAVVSFHTALGTIDRQLRNAGVQLIRGIDFDSVRTEHDWMTEAARLQLRHLRERGHRSLAFAHPVRPELMAMSEQKFAITHEEARGMGMTIASSFSLGADRDETSRTVGRWREANADTTAVICYNDDVALAVIGSLADNETAVPDEVAVIGTDDIPNAQYAVPPLSTLRADGATGAAHLAYGLLRAMGQDVEPAAVPHLFRLVVRGTT